jgi:hypothetical protein
LSDVIFEIEGNEIAGHVIFIDIYIVWIYLPVPFLLSFQIRKFPKSPCMRSGGLGECYFQGLGGEHASCGDNYHEEGGK